MNELKNKSEYFENLIGEITSIKQLADNSATITSKATANIVECLNGIFQDKICIDCIYTDNTENLLFGVMVSPTMTNVDLLNILVGNESVELDRYNIELDSKMIQMLESEEIASYIVEEVESIMYNNAIDNLRFYIDRILAIEDDNIDIKSSINANAILIFALKDSIRKLNSFYYKIGNPDICANGKIATELNIHDALVTAADKLKSKISDTEIKKS